MNKTTDIFKRTQSGFNTNEILSPSQDEHNSTNQSFVKGGSRDGNGTFDDVVNQQRDAYILEKMEQQHKL